MKLLCTSSSLAFVHSLRIALDGEDIATYFSDADATLTTAAGVIGGLGARLYVLHEEDWPRAVEIMRELSSPADGAAATQRPQRRIPTWAFVLAGTLAAIVVGAILGSGG